MYFLEHTQKLWIANINAKWFSNFINTKNSKRGANKITREKIQWDLLVWGNPLEFERKQEEIFFDKTNEVQMVSYSDWEIEVSKGRIMNGEWLKEKILQIE